MRKPLIIATVALVSLLGSNAFAQNGAQGGPGLDKAQPVARVTPEEKAAAKAARKEEGRKVARAHEGETDLPTSMGARPSPNGEKAAAKAKRRTATMGAAGARKESSTNGPN